MRMRCQPISTRRPARLLHFAFPLVLCACSILTGSPFSHADDWSQLRHDARNTALSSDVLRLPLHLAWSVQTQIKPDLNGNTLLAAGGVAAVSGAEDEKTNSQFPKCSTRLYDREGRQVWEVPQAMALYLSADALIVASNQNGGARIVRYNWRTHHQEWAYAVTDLNNIEAVVSDNTVYVTLLDSLTALDLPTGRARWQTPHIACEAADGKHFYFGGAHSLIAVDVHKRRGGLNFYDGGGYPLVCGNIVVGQGWGHWATGSDVEHRTILWRHNAWRGSAHSLVRTSAGRTLVVEAENDPVAVSALDIATGDLVWQHRIICGGYAEYDLTAAAPRLVFVPGCHEHLPKQHAPRGGFYALDADTGREKWKYEQPNRRGVSVVISHGVLYGLDHDGRLYCFPPASG